MTPPTLIADIVLGARGWLLPAVALAAAACAVVTWAYLTAASRPGLRLACAGLKILAVLLLAACLIEPLYSGTRPRPGGNIFLVLADNSRSLELTDRGANSSRGERMRKILQADSGLLTRLAQDYDLRLYTFDSTLQPTSDFQQLSLQGEASAIVGAVQTAAERFRGQPVAGMLVFTDGSATDSADTIDWKKLPPVYPVALAAEGPLTDVAVTQVAVSQTNFDAAPVTLVAELDARGLGGREVLVRLVDERGQEVERRKLTTSDAALAAQRFLVKPEKAGVSFYQVRAHVAGEEDLPDDARTIEATLANNRRWAVVDRGGGPYRVLYVGGMPNWEFKFLRRAIESDDEVKLVGLVRIAKREPKFTFLGRSGERTNPLFRGFGGGDDAEDYDQPVLIRLGTENADELRGGFPKDAEDLFKYHAIVLDDVEAAFFTQDQMSLLQRFVSRRGGGLLMTGGKNSFQEGGYARSAIGEMLPVYLDRATPVAGEAGYRLKLTREGWLQPWVRVRANEDDERRRLEQMPTFRAVNRIDAVKPGASVLAEVEGPDGSTRPALAVQSFGSGRVGALLVGDLWRWQLRREDHRESDLEKSWRQTVRWLTADVPQRVEVETKRSTGPGLAPLDLLIRARDATFTPLDNATVKISIQTPDARTIELDAQGAERVTGEYTATFAPRLPGVYRATVSVTAADGSEVGVRETGWAVEPETEEFRTLAGKRALLEQLARETGGEVISPDGVHRFVTSLPNRKIPVVEKHVYPLWHQWMVLSSAVFCLVGEWGLRRWKGLP